MLNSELIKTRLGHYGAVWLVAFVLAAIPLVAGPLLFGADLIGLADRVLPVMFALLGLGLFGFLVLVLISGETLGAKLAQVLLTAVLALPLLWAPVLAAVGAAFLDGRAIEYSEAYARFRIIVGQIVYPVIQAVFSGALYGTVWMLLQLFAAAVGVVSALAKAWPYVRRFLGREAASAG